MKTFLYMRKTILLQCFAALLMLAACVDRPDGRRQTAVIEAPPHITGDSLLFGLACDGCNDTLLVVLRDIYGSPDTFSVLQAVKHHSVYGMPRAGNRLAFMVDSDSAVARMVVVLDQLQGSWCYEARPTLRQRAGISVPMQQQFLRQLPDSVRDSLFAPREFGYTLSADGLAHTIGMRFLASDGPTVYPPLKRYNRWSISNGHLVFSLTTTDTLNHSTITANDTAELVRLRRDTLVLRFNDGEKKYYRKAP